MSNNGKNFLESFLSSELDDIYHYGIKGQKWGVRNYQNPDGTLTEAGKARYDDTGNYKNPEKMTTEDLIKSSNRLNLEYNYKRLQDVSTEEKRRNETNKAIGKAALASLLSVGATFGATFGIGALYNKMKGKKTNMGELAATAAIASLVAGAATIPNLFNAAKIPNVQVRAVTDKKEWEKAWDEDAKHSDDSLYSLYHAGVKGMKWGIRRYQNPDGTLTPEGKMRYGVNEFGVMSREGKRQYRNDISDGNEYAKNDKSFKSRYKKVGTKVGAVVGTGAAAAAVGFLTFKALGSLKDAAGSSIFKDKTEKGMAFLKTFFNWKNLGVIAGIGVAGALAGRTIGKMLGKRKDKRESTAFKASKKLTRRENRLAKREEKALKKAMKNAS